LGKVIGLLTLGDDTDIILSSMQGKLIKQNSSSIRSQGRATQGVKIINLKEDDKLVSVEKVKTQDDGNNSTEGEHEENREG
jgi:DNA gyrase subunit A